MDFREKLSIYNRELAGLKKYGRVVSSKSFPDDSEELPATEEQPAHGPDGPAGCPDEAGEDDSQAGDGNKASADE